MSHRTTQGKSEIVMIDFRKLKDLSNIDIVEEFYLAALDMKQLEWASAFLRVICQEFNQNLKGLRLLAMLYEAQGNTFKAQEIYLEILEGHPDDTQTLKRLISLYRYNDMVNDAIAMLNKYLIINQVDEEAWAELGDIYLSK